VTDDDDDYAKVFQVFDRDNTGGIDPFEFRAIMALLGERSTLSKHSPHRYPSQTQSAVPGRNGSP